VSTGSASAARRAERLARYFELRDQGIRRVDACRETGVSYEQTGRRYERAWKRARGIPPAPGNPGMGVS
jgi:hypothetical protein